MSKNKYKDRVNSERLNAGKLMTSGQITACNSVIHTASAACAVFGFLPIPIADAIPITTAQITMIISLGKVFEAELTETAAKSILAAVSAPLIGRTIASSFLKFVPVVGWAASGAIAAVITEAIGWIIANDFAKKYRNDYFEEKKRSSEQNVRADTSVFDEDDENEAVDPGAYINKQLL